MHTRTVVNTSCVGQFILSASHTTHSMKERKFQKLLKATTFLAKAAFKEFCLAINTDIKSAKVDNVE